MFQKRDSSSSSRPSSPSSSSRPGSPSSVRSKPFWLPRSSSLSSRPTSSRHARQDSLIVYAPKLRSLVLHHTALVPDYIKKMASASSHANNDLPLGRLEIEHCHVEGTATAHQHHAHTVKIGREILELVRKNHAHLQTVKLAGGVFPRRRIDVQDLASALKSCRHLRELRIALPRNAEVVTFDKKQWMALFQANAAQLQSVQLESWGLIEEDTDHLVEALASLHSLRELVLTDAHPLRDHHMDQLAGAIQNHTQKLRLARCPLLSCQSLLTVSSTLNANTKLQVLDLAGCDGLFLDDDDHHHHRHHHHRRSLSRRADDDDDHYVDLMRALAIFAQALRTNTSLVHLNLNSCGLNDDVFKLILLALEHNAVLKVLELNFNRITDSVGLEEHLSIALPNLQLRRLALRGLHSATSSKCRPWKPKRLSTFLVLLEQNSSLIAFELDEVRQDEAIDDLLQRNADLHPVLHSIDVATTVAPPFMAPFCGCLTAGNGEDDNDDLVGGGACVKDARNPYSMREIKVMIDLV